MFPKKLTSIDDRTGYLEMGIHADSKLFDLLKLKGDRFVVKESKKDELADYIAHSLIPEIVKRLRRTISNPDLAQDFAHEAFIKTMIVLSTDGIKDPQRLDGYCYRTAYLMYLQFRRKRQESNESWPDFEGVPDEQTNVELQVLRDQLTREVSSAIDNLRQYRDREVLRRRYFLEQPSEEICKALNLKEAHLHRVLNRARNRISGPLNYLKGSTNY